MRFFLLLCIPWWSLSALDFPSTPPVEPTSAAKTFHVLDGFEMQLIAAEPLVTDPVAITYDADGRAFVCEMNDYPYTDKASHKPSQENPTDAHIGKVRLLTDTDGDGTFDKATVFADGLSWPTGAACWKGGIFITATPDVWYLKDTNDDGVADVRQKVFTGFKKLNVQAVMNNPIWGLDHRIYIAGGSNGGEIQRVPGSESVMPIPSDFKPLPIKRNDFSFDPSTGDVRLESGGARFGNTFDDWGNRFLCNIRNPCQHVVLPYRYLARNPYLVVPSALNDCAEAGDQLPVYRTSPPEPWREFRAKRWVQEGSHLPKSELVGAGVVTSSSGITVYRGDAYPKEYRDFAFVADVAGNLFYRMKLVPDGVTFKAVQVDGNKNFCTSDDLWFRPVNFVNAPDGCLHVCDMYREVIEHPWSIPDDIHTAVDLLRGRDRGRIWRLTPRRSVVPPSGGSDKAPAKAGTTKRITPKLSQASTTDLVALLDHPNAWHRETAQRLLFEWQDKAAVEPLRELVKSGKTEQGRITAFWSLASTMFFGNPRRIEECALLMSDWEKLNKLVLHDDPALMSLAKTGGLSTEGYKLVSELASDVSPHMRAQVIKVFAHALFGSRKLEDHYELRSLAEKSFQDEDASVRFVAALSHTSIWSPASFPALGDLCVRDKNDPWMITSCKFAASSFPFQTIVRILASDQVPASESLQDLVEQLAMVIGADRSEPNGNQGYYLADYLASRSHVDVVALRCLKGFVQGLRRTSSTLGEVVMTDEPQMKNSRVSGWLREVGAFVIREAAREKADPQTRSIAITLLPDFLEITKALKVLGNNLTPDKPSDIQLTTLDTLGSYREPAVADMLIDAWPKMTPALRDKATTILLSRTDRIAKLLDAIEAKKITPAQLSVAAKATLGRQKTPALAERIAKLIGDGSTSNRKAVIETYLTAMQGSDAGTPARKESVVAGKSARITGDATRGAKVYETACMVCHKFADKGNDVGPHLGTIKAWTAEQLVTNILDPNREVSPNFSLYLVETNDGRTLSGLIASETAGNLTLKRADGGTDTVLRSEIKSLTSPGISLMPEGLEAAITPQQMADLIAYLKAG
jgi:putative membrane-bound dehydrogenase-like protein